MREITKGFFVISHHNDKHVSAAKAVKLIFDLDKKEGFVRYTCTGKLKTETILNILRNILAQCEEHSIEMRAAFTKKDNTE